MITVSAVFSYIRAMPRSGAPLSRTRVALQSPGVKFKHSPGHGSVQLSSGAGKKPAKSLLRGHINAAPPAEKFSTTPAALWKSRPGGISSWYAVGRGWLGRVATAAALGVSTVTAGRFVHTGSLSAMAQKVNLESAEGDWTKTKEFLLSLSVKDRREYYRTSSFVPLDDIPMWSPTKDGDGKQTFHLGKISLYSGDITKLEIDAIVNAANNSLLGGGGVDGAIHRAAGPLLKKECASLHGCETGQAKITCGYGLPAKYVIHTVGPIAVAGVGEQQKSALRSCYKKCLETATKNGVRSVAFPCISTGIYGYPPEQAVHVALATVREYLDEHHDKVDRVIFCVFLPMDKELYLQNLPLYFTAVC
ncbi:ADP-ribose glycohydrolase MACROD1 isoform X2 [Thalassophryne amazonica]|uniref:ADP-ribose glycohydrolase MACROD1 isoform X2 n=1 Tax=Thalassophryne amazonica TaxID=390379 RepID=UPI001470F7AC|nr:ADP-ribose glycohydrolase MACROD1 isoform X2 [Thalassophryne amazonica]